MVAIFLAPLFDDGRAGYNVDIGAFVSSVVGGIGAIVAGVVG